MDSGCAHCGAFSSCFLTGIPRPPLKHDGNAPFHFLVLLNKGRNCKKNHTMNEALKRVEEKVVAYLADVKKNYKAAEGLSGIAAVKSRVGNLWKSGRNGKITIVGCIVVLFLLIKPCFFVGPGLTEEQQVGANFLTAYMSGDFMGAVKYTDRPGTVNGDVEMLCKLDKEFDTREEREKAKRIALEGLELRRKTILDLGFDGCDVYLAEDKGSYSGSEHSFYDNNIVYRLVKGSKERLVELHLQREKKDKTSKWRVMAHPFSFL